MQLPEYREELSSQIPAAQLLIALGYTYLSPQQALEQRGERTRNVILTGILEPWLREHNHFTVRGKKHTFNDSAIQEALRRINDVPLVDGLKKASQGIYELISLGFSTAQVVDGDKKDYSLVYIDWTHPERNVFHVTEEFVVEREGSHQTRRPDLVCFVNGIPFAVIECKRPDLESSANSLPHEQAISQHLRNQQAGEIRPLFAYAQLLLAVSTNHAAYATTETNKKFWVPWREEDPAYDEERVTTLINTGLKQEQRDNFFNWRAYPQQVRQWFDRQAVRLPSVQDRTIVSLLSPERLLELSQQFIVYDALEKKIARYQQYFAVKATLGRVVAFNAQGERTGGVIWHTTGSGKSLTMVMLAKALFLHPAVRNPRIILVTDRVNLDNQISTTFKHCGAEIVQAQSGRHLVELVRSERAEIIATVINKFEKAADEKIMDDNPDIFVLVDESHRSQYGLIHNKMRRVFPRACYIGFTGTPLTKKEKSTALKFGSFIHKYPMRQAVEDGAVLPLLYEGRLVKLDSNQAQLDRWFERHTAGLNDDQKADLKHKMSRANVVNETERRIQEIAYNLSEHFERNFKDKQIGFKAQLATSSKRTALKYKKYIDECGLLTSRVVISPPDSREGHEDTSFSNQDEVLTFWQDMTNEFNNEEEYTRQVLESFGNPEGIDLIIVVDKLLVGFDEPLNTVLYIDKPLKDHAILQAIARVNRLHAGKEFGLVVDYRGVLGELNTAIETYDALADFDSEDIAGTIADVSAIIDKLPQHHSDLWAVFNGVNTKDPEAMRRFLAPEDLRQQFYEALSTYAKTLKVALSSTHFYENTSEGLIYKYKSDLKKFHSLRQDVKLQYAETINFQDYEQKIRKLLDAHIGADGVTLLTKEVEIFDQDAFDEAVSALGSPRAKAEAILNHLKRSAFENMELDPAYYRKFSQLIEDTLRDITEGRISELEALRLAGDLRDQEREGRRTDLPGDLDHYRDAPAYYGIIGEVMGARVIKEEQATFSIEMEKIIEACKVTDWQDNLDVKHTMANRLEDALYDLETKHGVSFTPAELDEMIDGVIDVARKRG